jgi:galactokinase
MTGGGFGGCAVALMPLEKVESVRLNVTEQYRSPTGEVGTVYVCAASAGAGILV